MNTNSKEALRLNNAPAGKINAAAVRQLFSEFAKQLKSEETITGSVSSFAKTEKTLSFVFAGMSVSMNIQDLNR